MMWDWIKIFRRQTTLILWILFHFNIQQCHWKLKDTATLSTCGVFGVWNILFKALCREPLYISERCKCMKLAAFATSARWYSIFPKHIRNGQSLSSSLWKGQCWLRSPWPTGTAEKDKDTRVPTSAAFPDTSSFSKDKQSFIDKT